VAPDGSVVFDALFEAVVPFSDSPDGSRIGGDEGVAFYIARMGEHPLVRHLLSGIRLLVYMSAALAFVAAGALAFGVDSDDLRSLWGVLRFVALLPVAGLATSWLQLHLRKPRSRPLKDPVRASTRTRT
jgi:hypothetical protein